MSRKLAVVCLLLVLALPALSQRHENPQIATWEAKFDLDNELYPSYVLVMSGPNTRNSSTPGYYGDSSGLAEVWIVPSIPNAQVHVEVQIEGWTSLSEIDVTLPEAGKRYRVVPFLRYDFARLAETDQSIPATVTYTARVNGTDLGRDMLSIRVRSVNDVPFYASTSLSGEPQDLTPLFAGYVNESHTFIPKVLQEALKYKAINAFSGYQVDPAGVRLQVFAIWNVLQRRQLHYSNITTPSAVSPSGQVYSQAVRFIDQSIDSQQANCVDGSVLFASILYKIGIEPILVLMPGHMFVGYYLDADHKKFEFLETTMIGAGHQPGASNIAFSQWLHPVELSESWGQFVAAIQCANQVFEQEVRPAINQSKPQYKFIDIAKFRQAGINAIPRPVR